MIQSIRGMFVSTLHPPTEHYTQDLQNTQKVLLDEVSPPKPGEYELFIRFLSRCV